MNRVTDLLLSAQLTTIVAAVFTFLAHIIDNGTILNPNWQWAVYVLLALACFFMVFPHLIAHEE